MKKEKRDTLISLMLTRKEKELFEAEAKKRGMSVSALLRSSTLKEINK